MSLVPIPTIRQAVSALQLIASFSFLLAATPDAAYSAPANPKTISIAEARSLPLGTVVTVDGSLTVPSGAFSSSTFDEGFAIQDHTGGIYISVADNLGFAPRQQLRVTGKLADSFGLLTLTDVTDTKAHGSGPKVQALPVATGAVGEATEGKIVRIAGTITRTANDAPFGFMIFVDDGSGEIKAFVSTSTGIDVNGLSPGLTIEVTGFSGQFDAVYEVDPRFQSDLKALP